MIKRIWNNSWLRCLLGLLLLVIVVLYPISVYAIKTHAGMSYIVTSLLFALPILIGALWLPKKWMFCIFSTILAVISLVELTMVDLYGEYLMPGGILSTIMTNPQEATEFFDTNLKEVYRWIPLIILSVLTCIVYSRPKFSPKIWISTALCLLIPMCFVGYKMIWYANRKDSITLRFYMDNRVWNRPPYNIFFASYNAHKILEQRRLIAQAENMRFGAYREDSCSQKEIYVLAIGESLRYSNVSLNGVYPRSTTPRLESVDNLVLFNNYYSQACFTMLSVPMLLTRATPTNYDLNYAERSIIEPYRECGFSTFVIANTNLLTYETYLSNGCDSLIAFSNIVQDGEIMVGDKTIVRLIDSLAQEHDKLFVLCQFYGNHSFYTNYEPEFDVYHPNSNDPGIDYTKEALINAYDNSILYADYILSSIIDVINKENTCSAMIFISDHGEEIHEGGGGHGGNCAPIKDEYHVPFIFWCSDTYKTNNPERLMHAKSLTDAKTNGDNIFFTTCGMAGIKLDSIYSQPEYNVLSSDFKEHERLILLPDFVNTLNPDE